MTFIELTVVSIILTIIIVIITRILTNPAEIRKLKSQMEFHKGKANDAQKSGDAKAAQEHMKGMMSASQKQFGHNMKPMMVTMMLVIIVLGWMSTTYKSVSVTLPFNFPLWGSDMGWFWWYVLIGLPVNMAFRKLLGVE
jgi:uncharacterized membrane protein (DUF106 family)